MATSTKTLSTAIVGLWRKKANDMAELPQSFRFAPVVLSGVRGEYQILTRDLRLSLANAGQGKPSKDWDSYETGALGFSTVSVNVGRYKSEGFPLPYSYIEGLQDANAALEVANLALQAVKEQCLVPHVRALATVGISALTNPAAGTLDLSTPATDLVTYFTSVIEEIQLATGLRPNAIYLSERAVNRLATMDTLQNGVSITSAASPTATRRTGYVSNEAVHAFFRSMNLELIVEGSTLLGLNSAGAWALGDVGFIGFAGPGGTFTTFARRDMTNGSTGLASILKLETREMGYPSPSGIAVTGDSFWEVQATFPDSGREIAINF